MKRVSKHAHQRGLERGGVSNKKIKEVMMYGYPPVYYEGPFRYFLDSVKNTKGGAVTVKVKDDIMVIYNKRSQRAITMYRVPERFRPADDYLLPVFKKPKDYKEVEGIGDALWKYLNSVEVFCEYENNGSSEKSE